VNNLKKLILAATNSSECEEVEVIQSLWSGYGKISRYKLKAANFNTVIVKNIVFPNQVNHPRGWNTDRSHNRKVKSYQVETEWYKTYSQLSNDACRVPVCYGGENVEGDQFILLEDLNAMGYSVRKSMLTPSEVRVCLKWLANFHATYMGKQPKGLWKYGTYWHLETRPDELSEMNDSSLKQAASSLDNLLNNSKFQTFVHGDAKVANFCFSIDMKHVAAVDFQYVGGGCGMKDIAYLLGSCLTESECDLYEEKLLNYYFNELKIAINKTDTNVLFNEIESEWRKLYPIAWADFTRFLMGWMPTHQKINSYSKKMVDKALDLVNV